jgi:hypothetical protein
VFTPETVGGPDTPLGLDLAVGLPLLEKDAADQLPAHSLQDLGPSLWEWLGELLVPRPPARGPRAAVPDLRWSEKDVAAELPEQVWKGDLMPLQDGPAASAAWAVALAALTTVAESGRRHREESRAAVGSPQ